MMLNTTIVIDDSESDRYLARRALNKAGVTKQVLEFSDPTRALELLSDREAFQKECGPCPPRALMLLDINMPRMSGFEFLQALEQRIQVGAIPAAMIDVVMYSTSDFQPDIDKATAYDMVIDYVTKPITPESVARIVQRAAALHG